MNKEYLMIAAMGSAGILGAIGGTGFKPARRFIMPFILGLLAYLAGFLWWRCLILCLGLIVALHQGYGDKVPYWRKALVGAGFSLPTLALGLTPWQIVIPVAWILMFRLSNWKYTARMFSWKIVEFLIFCLIGVAVAALL